MALILTAALLLTPTDSPCPSRFIPHCAELEGWGKPPPPPPLSPPSGTETAGVERWRPIVEHFWDEPHTSRMLRIMRCESGGDPNAWNRSTDVRGLFQVRYPLWSKLWPGDYWDPWTNAAIAYQVWREQGYRAWACRG